MKTSKIISLVIALTASSMAISETEKQYKFKGDSEALSICKSIAADNTAKLSANIQRAIKNDRVKSYYLKNSSAVLKDYSCNKLSLMKFANRTNAYNSAKWLNDYKGKGSSIFMEEISAAEQAETLEPKS